MSAVYFSMRSNILLTVFLFVADGVFGAEGKSHVLDVKILPVLCPCRRA